MFDATPRTLTMKTVIVTALTSPTSGTTGPSSRATKIVEARLHHAHAEACIGGGTALRKTSMTTAL
jgi:hypothetical protein